MWVSGFVDDTYSCPSPFSASSLESGEQGSHGAIHHYSVWRWVALPRDRISFASRLPCLEQVQIKFQTYLLMRALRMCPSVPHQYNMRGGYLGLDALPCLASACSKWHTQQRQQKYQQRQLATTCENANLQFGTTTTARTTSTSTTIHDTTNFSLTWHSERWVG